VKKHYAFVDYATQAYSALTGLLILCFHNQTVERWGWLVAAHAAGLVLVHGLILAAGRFPANRALDLLRHFYPVLLYTAFFCETGAINRMFFPDYLDPVAIRLEQAVFGCQPSVLFVYRLPWLVVSEVFYAAYFSYYVMIAGIGLALFLRDRRQFFHYVSVVSFVFYVCYVIYIIIPIIGPRTFFGEYANYRLPAEVQRLAIQGGYPEAIRAGVFYRLMGWVYRVFESPGAALPSSHVAVAVCTVFFSFRYLPRIRYPHLLAAVLLCAATVYCRYHYLIDVVLGLVAAGVLIPLGNWLYFRFQPERGERGVGGGG
jgi:membrane-associated phospholipid phosphatase